MSIYERTVETEMCQLSDLAAITRRQNAALRDQIRALTSALEEERRTVAMLRNTLRILEGGPSPVTVEPVRVEAEAEKSTGG